MQPSKWSLTRGEQEARQTLTVSALFGTWLLLAGWLAWNHVFWRDEVRAYSLALSGSSMVEMLRNVHGEGHPALWYVILRSVHTVFPYRQVLPVVAAIIGIASMAVVTFWSPYRTIIIALILFSFFGAFEYVVMARNYGIAALAMFSIAGFYPRIKNTLWLGLAIAVLCNTNVPSCLLGAGFVVFRLVEMLTGQHSVDKREWRIFAANCFIAAAGALVCFRTVYPTFNDGAVSANLQNLSGMQLLKALADGHQGFANLGIPSWAGMPSIVLALSCLAFVRKLPALCAGFTALILLKLFFYFVYVSYYRHEALFIVFLLCLHWMTAHTQPMKIGRESLMNTVQFIGLCAFVELLAIQIGLLSTVIDDRLLGVPYSRSADVAELLRTPQLSRAIVIGDPDTMLEPLPYYVDNPLWFLREQRFGIVVKLTHRARKHISLDDILADARRLNSATGRPVVFLFHLPLSDRQESDFVMFDDTTAISPETYQRFRAATGFVARLRPSTSDESYDVYVYPR